MDHQYRLAVAWQGNRGSGTSGYRDYGRDVLLRAAAILAETAPDPQDPARIRLELELMFLTGWAPADNQQKPLRPGSAKTSLAAALSQRTQ